MKTGKPLGKKAYGHIPHLPGSRITPADHKCTEGQKRICTEKKRDQHDIIIVTEKVDGSCTAVAKIDGMIYPLNRAGYVANTSPFPQHHYFFDWVMERQDLFLGMLKNGERIVGEWLAQAHGTRYNLPHEPWVVFDIMRGDERALWEELTTRAKGWGLTTPRLLNMGAPFSIKQGLEAIKVSGHGAIDPVEGFVMKVERKGKVDFLAKYVRPDKIDGLYLPEISGKDPVWNWKPKKKLEVA